MNVPVGATARALAVEASSFDPEGVASLASGTLHVAGHDVGTRAHVARVGAAPFDPALPPEFSLRELVEWSAKLAGLGRLARPRAMEALDRVGLAKAALRAIRTLAVPEKRALLLAHAAVASPDVIIAETPVADLDGDAAGFVLTALSRVSEGRASIVSVARLVPGSPESTLAERADQLVYLSRGEIMFSAKPSEMLTGRRYGLTVRTNTDAFRTELAARGLELAGGPERFSVALREGKETADILAAAASARAAVVEMLLLM